MIFAARRLTLNYRNSLYAIRCLPQRNSLATSLRSSKAKQGAPSQEGSRQGNHCKRANLVKSAGKTFAVVTSGVRVPPSDRVRVADHPFETASTL